MLSRVTVGASLLSVDGLTTVAGGGGGVEWRQRMSEAVRTPTLVITT
jgi:hypothetical protein